MVEYFKPKEESVDRFEDMHDLLEEILEELSLVTAERQRDLHARKSGACSYGAWTKATLRIREGWIKT